MEVAKEGDVSLLSHLEMLRVRNAQGSNTAATDNITAVTGYRLFTSVLLSNSEPAEQHLRAEHINRTEMDEQVLINKSVVLTERWSCSTPVTTAQSFDVGVNAD